MDERYSTGGSLATIGILTSWIANNPAEVVSIVVAIIGAFVMVSKRIDDHRERRERAELNAQEARERELRIKLLEKQAAGE